MDTPAITHATLTCPICGFPDKLEIPADACLFFHCCANCNMQLRSLPGDCCVFCSYGDTVCIPRQREQRLVPFHVQRLDCRGSDPDQFYEGLARSGSKAVREFREAGI